jgi:4-cresol dehydrogenase (hydroxylating)
MRQFCGDRHDTVIRRWFECQVARRPLEGLRKVLEINHEPGYAVVEPGVSWFDRTTRSRRPATATFLFTIPDLGWGSVIGNSLDDGVTYIAF